MDIIRCFAGSQHQQHTSSAGCDQLLRLQVLFLDADNLAVADPTTLLASPEYLQTGVLLWPDFWDSSAAPDVVDVLEIPALLPGTFESGQMLLDKERCACPLQSLVAAAQHDSYNPCAGFGHSELPKLQILLTQRVCIS